MVRLYKTSASVDVRDGAVFVHAPGGAVFPMTPEAAAELSDRLLHAAAYALGQTINPPSKRDDGP